MVYIFIFINLSLISFIINFLDIPIKKTLKDFFKPISKNIDPSSHPFFESETSNAAQKRPRIEFNINDLIVDPGKRKPIEEYDTSIRDQVRREYLLK